MAITASNGGVAAAMAEQIVDLVHHVRKRGPGGQHPSIRAAVMIAKVLASQGLSCDPTNALVVSTCRDVLHLNQRAAKGENPALPEDLPALLQTIWAATAGRTRVPRPLSPASAPVERGARMRSGTRRGLRDIRTRGGLGGELENPQRKYLHAASLELKKSLCRKVRDAAKKRAEEMEEKIAELDDEKAILLAAGPLLQPAETDAMTTSPPAVATVESPPVKRTVPVSPGGHPGDSGSPAHGFTLRY